MGTSAGCIKSIKETFVIEKEKIQKQNISEFFNDNS